MAACWWVGKRRNLPRETAPADRAKFRRDLLLSLPAIALPVLIVVFLRFGIATPTEVAVLAALFSGAVSALLYRDLSLRRLHRAILEAGLATGVVLMVIMASAAIGWLLTFDQVPQNIALWVQQNVTTKWVVILLMNLMMLFLGMFIDLPAAVLLLTPVFLPLAQAVGMDPIQLGILGGRAVRSTE
jgi:tripartite ATP-independent transporter DctM subunit